MLNKPVCVHILCQFYVFLQYVIYDIDIKDN